MNSLLKILHLEDNSLDAELVREKLLDAAIETTLTRVDSKATFLEALSGGDFDLILADYSLPTFDGISALATVREMKGDVPFIFVSGTIGEEIAIESLKCGATDYILKDRLQRLGLSVRRAFREAEERAERRHGEEKIREQAALLDLAPDAIIVRNLENRIQFWSKGAERLYGWTAQETDGNEINERLFHDAASFKEAEKLVLERGEWQGELRQLTKSGQTIIVHSRWTLLRDAQGNPKSFLSINTDTTETKKLEAQFLRTQRMESIGRLASGIAHDLNNILAPILICVPMLRWGVSPAELEKTLHTIETSAQRGAEVVKQLLTYGRGVEGQRIALQPKHLIQEMANIAQETFPKNIVFKSQFLKSLWALTGDTTQLHQVLMNLCVNARDAMIPQGGTLTLTAENIRLDKHSVRLHPEATAGPYVLIQVKDTGKGIPAEIIEKVFDPFFTTKDLGKGSGLGLSTVLGIVKSHGGFVNLRSEVETGTTFEIYLPANPEAEVLAAAKQTETLPQGQGELILVVDDEIHICQVTKKTLEKHGYRTLTACNGIEAVALYSQHRDEIRLVLTDLMMPLMDGLTLVRVLKKLNPDVKVITSSGIGGEADKSENSADLSELGVRVFLNKPYTVEKMLGAFHEMLHDQP